MLLHEILERKKKKIIHLSEQIRFLRISVRKMQF
jgi:hypothetical protein